MHRLREQIEVDAPVAVVWAAVHRDISEIPMWSRNLVSAEVVGGGATRAGSELLYVARLPGGLTQDLHLRVTVYERNRRCAGTLEASAMTGTWEWRYRSTAGRTQVTYATTVKLKGVLRLAGGALEDQVRKDVRHNLEALKLRVEGRKGQD